MGISQAGMLGEYISGRELYIYIYKRWVEVWGVRELDNKVQRKRVVGDGSR